MPDGTDRSNWSDFQNLVIYRLDELKQRQQEMHVENAGKLKDATFAHAGILADHGERITDLEAAKEQTEGFIKAVKWLGGILWAAVLFIAGLLGWHVAGGK